MDKETLLVQKKLHHCSTCWKVLNGVGVLRVMSIDFKEGYDFST